MAERLDATHGLSGDRVANVDVFETDGYVACQRDREAGTPQQQLADALQAAQASDMPPPPRTGPRVATAAA